MSAPAWQVRRLVVDAIDRQRTQAQVTSLSARAVLTRLAVVDGSTPGHSITLYGPGPLWGAHAHYHGGLGHWRVAIERQVALPVAIAELTPAQVVADYTEKLALCAQRPYLSAAQLDRLWTIAEKLKVPDLAVYAMRDDLAPGVEVAQLDWKQYERLVRAIQNEGERVRQAENPRYKAAQADRLSRLVDALCQA